MSCKRGLKKPEGRGMRGEGKKVRDAMGETKDGNGVVVGMVKI